ncbi:MAG: ABC transporter ATP-binding protein [Acholeplasmatales bacterium]|nr:MAG: ABC transporter ATP-binding protein [Acholeplasmatales bacterium]
MNKPNILSRKEIRERAGLELLGEGQKGPQAGRSFGFRGGRGRGMAMAKPKSVKQTVRRLLGYLGFYKFIIVLVALISVAASLLNLLIPLIFSRAIDVYIIPGDYGGLFRLVIIILIIALGNSLIRFITRFSMVKISQSVIKTIRADAFDSLMAAPLSYYDDKGSGDTVSRLSNDVELINATLGQTVLEVINSLIVFIGALVYMFILNWALAILVVLFIPVMILFTTFIGKRTRTGFKDQQKHLATLNGIIEENISGLKAVKLYNQETAFTEDFQDENNKLRKAGFTAQVYAGLLWPFILFMNNLIYLTVIAVGALFHLYNWFNTTIGQIAGVSVYSRMFIMPISNIAQLFNTLMQGVAGAERVFELIDTESEYANEGPETFDKFVGAISFENVQFGYVEGVPVLKNISFSAEPGQVIAIVGPTGGGKTTTINLINRFYDVDAGRITLDGIDIRQVGKDSLRKRVGVVLQDTKLFKGTVFENIHYGDFSSPEDRVYEAAKQAGAHDFIVKLPKGYETEVTEGGENFSQGERQLISIARTLLNNPDLLILDEATSNIDTRTEAKIRSSMETLMQNRTSIVIAHRLQTIEKADTILVIHEGQLIERGTHKELLTAGGFYHDLYHAQFDA